VHKLKVQRVSLSEETAAEHALQNQYIALHVLHLISLHTCKVPCVYTRAKMGTTLTYTVFSLGEAQLHQLHTSQGKVRQSTLLSTYTKHTSLILSDYIDCCSFS
jgi:hypothetical protein